MKKTPQEEKKEYEKPVVHVLYFDEEELMRPSDCGGGGGPHWPPHWPPHHPHFSDDDYDD